MSNIKVRHVGNNNKEELYGVRHVNRTEVPVKCQSTNKEQIGKDLSLIFRNSFNKFSQITDHRPTALDMAVSYLNNIVSEMDIKIETIIDTEDLTITVV